MSQIDELSQFFPLKAAVFTKSESVALVAEVSAGYLGPAALTTDPALLPTPPVAGNYFSFTAIGTYSHFLGSDGIALTIADPGAGNAILDGRLYYAGAFWIQSHGVVAVPSNGFISTDDSSDTTNLLKFTDKNGVFLFGLKTGNKFYPANYLEASIPTAAIKNPEDFGMSGVTSTTETIDPIVEFRDKNNLPWLQLTADGKVAAPNGFKNIGIAALEQSIRNILMYPSGKPQLVGKKLVTLGDSITYESSWQAAVASATGLVWSGIETTLGISPNPQMGVPGSTIIPAIISNGSGGYNTGRAPGNSIYYRADYVSAYSPDYVILFGGQNDRNSYLTVGTINDDPYTGAEVSGSTTPPTFYAAYKGTLIKLLTANPSAKVFAMTTMWNGTGSAPGMTSDQLKSETINTAIRTCCELFSVPVIDLWRKSGITPLNTSIFFRDSQIHPNALGGETRMAPLIANSLF